MTTTATKRCKAQLLSLDLGNFGLRAFDGDTVKTIRSLQTPLAKGQRVLSASEASPIIELDGQRWHVGSQCRYYRSSEATVTGDKTQLAQLHLASCIAESGDYQLIASHHSPDAYQDFLASALIGDHHYVRNETLIDIAVQSVEVIPEGYGSYHLACMHNYVPSRGYTVLIDIGGSTWLSTVYAANGQVIDHDAHERQGTYALATEIANDDRLRRPLIERYSITSPDPVVIQEGFCANHYYGESDLCWVEWLPEYLDPWWKGITQTLKARYQPHLPSVRRFLVTGGGSHLVAHKLVASDAFIVLPDSDTASVQGAYFAFESALSFA